MYLVHNQGEISETVTKKKVQGVKQQDNVRERKISRIFLKKTMDVSR